MVSLLRPFGGERSFGLHGLLPCMGEDRGTSAAEMLLPRGQAQNEPRRPATRGAPVPHSIGREQLRGLQRSDHLFRHSTTFCAGVGWASWYSLARAWQRAN